MLCCECAAVCVVRVGIQDYFNTKSFAPLRDPRVARAAESSEMISQRHNEPGRDLLKGMMHLGGICSIKGIMHLGGICSKA